MIEKQLKVIKKIAIAHYDKNPAHFQTLIDECNAALEQMKEDNLLYLEALESVEEYEEFDLREIA